MSPTISHRIGRPKATDRVQPRKSKKPKTEHTDKYADLPMETRLADLVDHFHSEERANERR